MMSVAKVVAPPSVVRPVPATPVMTLPDRVTVRVWSEEMPKESSFASGSMLAAGGALGSGSVTDRIPASPAPTVYESLSVTVTV